MAFSCETMGRIDDTCIIFNPPTHLFFHPIFLTSSQIWYQSFFNSITNFFFLHKFFLEEFANTPMCNLLKTMHNVWLQQFGKRELVCMLQHWMTMFKLSNIWHYIFISSRVVDQVKGLIRMSCSCVEQPNLEIWSNLQT